MYPSQKIDKCRMDVCELIRMVFTTMEMIQHLSFKEDRSIVNTLIKLAEHRCDDISREVNNMYIEIGGETDVYNKQREIVAELIKILKLQVSAQRDNTDNRKRVFLDQKCTHELVCGIMR